MTTPQDLLSALARAYALTETRFSGDPELVEAIEEVRRVQKELGWVVVRVGADAFRVDGEQVRDTELQFERIRSAARDAGIAEIRFQEVVHPEALQVFLKKLHRSSAKRGVLPSARFREVVGQIGLSFQQTRVPPSGMVGGIQDLFRASPGGKGDLQEESAKDDGARPAAKGVIPPDQALVKELAEEVVTYLNSFEPSRSESERRLRAVAEELTKARDYAALCELVQLLAESDGAEKPDDGALSLAREFTTPAVASNLVARLGGEKDPTERSRLKTVIGRVGREGGLALVHAIGESEDRSERRAFLDAMVTLGPLAMEMAERMLGDPRWFVVRNGVTILGELGGEEVIPLVTETLSNEDSRVRKEAVLALTKVALPEAEGPLLGMVRDGDPEVRAMVARALGVVGSDQAVQPLLKLLKDSNPDVQAECLQALGQIGDAAAVQPIEKKALGGIFKRPPRAVRISAFRALAAIGTPRALRVVRKGVNDSDGEVRTVVRSLGSKSKR
jgi:HEAT repeat protein